MSLTLDDAQERLLREYINMSTQAMGMLALNLKDNVNDSTWTFVLITLNAWHKLDTEFFKGVAAFGEGVDSRGMRDDWPYEPIECWEALK